jgi:integrase
LGDLQVHSTELKIIQKKVIHFLKNSKSKNTLRAYNSDWRQFQRWCHQNNFPSIPTTPQILLLFITHLTQTHKLSSIKRKIATISEVHNTANVINPVHSKVIVALIKGIARELGSKKAKKKAMRLVDIRQIISLISDNPIGVRDKAILLVGLGGGFRRSELADLDFSDVEFFTSGMTVHIRKSKTDQDGIGYYKTIGNGKSKSTCPVIALKKWFEVSQIKDGKLFRQINKSGKIGIQLSGNAVAMIVKKWVRKLGLEEKEYAGHSLRSGFVSEAKEAGIPNELIMKMTNHKSEAMIHTYYQGGEKQMFNLSTAIGF